MEYHEGEVCQCWEEKRYLHMNTNPFESGKSRGPCVCPPFLLSSQRGRAEFP